MATITIELESSLGNVREYECECFYNPESTGGSYGMEYEHISESYSIIKIFRKGIDVTKWIFFSKELTQKFNEKVDELL